MNSTPGSAAVQATQPVAARSGLLSTIDAYLELSKARLSALVVLTTAAGFVLASPRPIDWTLFAWTLIGTALAALGVNALNQWYEVPRDARMNRTRNRPLPAGVLRPAHALFFGLTASIAGPIVLGIFANELAVWLTVICELVYLAAYTPMKVRTPLNTLVGAICGAIPPMIGWAAAAGRLEAGAWVLGAILFVWQIPHFLALAWVYRDDYLRGGFRMLPSVDRTGRLTSQTALLYSLLLVPVSLGLTTAGTSGAVYAVGAVLLGLWLVAAAALFAARVDDARARRLFLASVIYLPLLLALMVFDASPASPAGPAPDRHPAAVVLSPSDTPGAAAASVSTGRASLAALDPAELASRNQR